MRSRISRKGSMQLSIEAIIILVIAIVLLGLGIGFIKGFFGKGSEALLGKFEPLKEDCDVNANNPIIPKEISLKQGETNSIKVCVYNNDENKITAGIFKFVKCVGPGATAVSISTDKLSIQSGATKAVTIKSLDQDIDRGKTAGYKTTIDVASNADLGTYICNIEVSCATGCPAPPAPSSGKVGPTQVTFTVS